MKKTVLWGCLTVAACTPAPQVQPDPHYVVGQAWQAGGQWFYPREDFSWQGTGVAIRQEAKKGELTADGEVSSDITMTGSHPTLQLPAIVRVTNLENGREITIRLNDRGPGQAGRLIGLSRQAATLLGVGDAPVQVRIVEDEMASRKLAENLPGGPMLQISMAPLEAVQQADLAGGQAGHVGAAVAGSTPVTQIDRRALVADLSVEVRQGQPAPGMLWVETMDFTSRTAAMTQAARQGAGIRPVLAGHGMMWAVRYGPFVTIQEADAALHRALASGFNGSHLVVE